ncbi:probable cytochrome P450 305a1 [Maniola jurtina]|uniref:probable cytochrome P450 305a1 n=1 Tax=Maniola jurtina TaxID=191418 RepID=UPI001E6867F2|nr:probable cytochrome P450 305a1 [Maniola jurtina]XP_045785007.1 probable cytochrome P450 305a1 [Maniola jurtina]
MFVFISIVLIFVYIFSTVIKPKKYPPGPRWYPFFGCFGLINSRMKQHGSQWKVLSEMAKEFSTKVLGLKLGNQLVVVVYGEKNIRQVTTEKEFDARPDSFFLKLRTFGKRVGITFVDGPLWREHRPFTMKHLRKQGFGKPPMEQDIQAQLNNILDVLGKSNGSSISIRTPMSIALVNIIWKYVAGEHIEENKLRQFLQFSSARSKAFTLAGGYLDQWPWLRFIFPNWTGYNIIKNMNKEILDIIEDAIWRHHSTVEGNDYIYSFLKEIYDNKDTYTEDQLKGVCLDILIAASNTGSSALDFAFICLLRHPNVQNKVYEEISRVLGDDTPSWSDNGRLIYTSAFLSEVHRLCTVAPFLGGRRALTDIEMEGYLIPKGTTILVSLGDLHQDETLWDEPNTFKPERFIDENGALKTPANLYPFGLGRRRCPGEPLGRCFIFIMLVGIVQKYRLQCNGPPPSAESVIGLLAEPIQFTAQFVKRL